MRVLIRVDGSETIGMGPLTRCLPPARARTLPPAVEVEFVTQDEPAALRQLEKAGFRFHPLPRAVTRQEQWRALRDLAVQKGSSAVLVDLRELAPEESAGVMATGAVVGVIDEWGRKEVRADLLFNGTAVAAWHRYTTDPSVACHLGLDYALLEPAFVQVHETDREIQEKARRVLVVLGGDDPFHLTVKVMESLELLPEALEITAVVGPAFLDEEEIRRCAERSRHRAVVLKNIRDVAQRMSQTDLALTGGGLTALEVACTGTPALIVCEVDHQVETADALQKTGAVVNLGLGVQASREAIAGKVAALLADGPKRLALSQAGKRLVDGRGTERVARILMETLAARVMP
jgi:spore coat polysaccharide biosynthesis predicted glycosyltransferase SpsG